MRNIFKIDGNVVDSRGGVGTLSDGDEWLVGIEGVWRDVDLDFITDGDVMGVVF